MFYKIVADGCVISESGDLPHLNFPLAAFLDRWEVRVDCPDHCDRVIARVCMPDRPDQRAWAAGVVAEELKAREAAGTLVKVGPFQVGEVFRPGYGLPYTSKRQDT